MGSPIPYMQFSPLSNPMDTAIQTALGVYGAGMQGRQNKAQTQNLNTQNQMNQAKMPYIGQQAQAELQNTQAQAEYNRLLSEMYPEKTRAEIANMASENAKRQADIRMQQQMLAFLNGRGGNEGGNSMSGGGTVSTGAGNPGLMGNPGEASNNPNTSMGSPLPPSGSPQPEFMQGAPDNMQQPMGMNSKPNAGYTGLPSYTEQAAAKYFGLPEFSAEQQLRMDAIKNQQNQTFNKDLEKNAGTSGHITKIQDQGLALENLIPMLAEFINLDVPVQMPSVNPWATNHATSYNPFAIDEQALYSSQLSNLKDTIMQAKDLPQGAESLRTIGESFGKHNFESEEAYKKRLKNDEKHILRIYENVTGKPYTGQTSETLSKERKNEKLSIDNPDVIFTAKKHGISPQAVIDKLKSGRR